MHKVYYRANKSTERVFSMSDKEYMSLEEVAEFLGVTYQLVYKLARSGELPAARLGKLYRISRKDLEEYLESNKRENAGGGVCSVCGEVYRSKGSLKHVCQEDGCEALICNDCWTRRGVRKCGGHSK